MPSPNFILDDTVHLSGFCRFGSDVGNEEVPHAYHNLRSSGRHVVAGNGEFLHVGRFPSHSLVTSRSNRPYRNHSRTRRIMSSTYDGANPTGVRQRSARRACGVTEKRRWQLLRNHADLRPTRLAMTVIDSAYSRFRDVHLVSSAQFVSVDRKQRRSTTSCCPG